MDFKQFNLLEAKILSALEYIKQLKTENAELREQILQLKQNETNNSPADPAANSGSKPALTEREIYISKKIAEMLKKIEALETKI